MMYPFMTLNDDTEITHSEMKPDGRVKVYIETPDEKDGFHNSDKEMDFFRRLVQNNAHLIMEFSQEGGILDASNL